MRLTVLGCSGTHPTATNPGSGYVVTSEAARLWVDAGPGTFQALLHRTDPADLDGIIISHIHPDHCSDLLAAFHWLAYGPGGGPLPVFAPAGVADAFADFVDAGPKSRFWDVFTFTEVKSGTEARVCDVHLTFGHTDHPVATVATRFEAGGRVLTYSSDTGPGGDAFELAFDSHLFLCEASFIGDPEAKVYQHHLTATEAGTLATVARCERLALTHILPGVDTAVSAAEAAAVFAGDVLIAEPGAQWEV